MSQIFHHSTNTFARITIFGAVFILAFLGWAFTELDHSAYSTRATQPRDGLQSSPAGDEKLVDSRPEQAGPPASEERVEIKETSQCRQESKTRLSLKIHPRRSR